MSPRGNHISSKVRGLGLAFLTSVAGLLCVTSGVAASSDAAAALPQVSCPSGTVLVLPTSSELTADGWVRMRYDLEGTTAYREAPPVGFDTVGASSDTLKLHHMPDSAEWRTNLTAKRLNRTKGLCGDPSKTYGSYKNSQNWAGDEVWQYSSLTFRGVSANFVQQPWNGQCGSNSWLGSWVGLGGDGDVLLQAGTQVGASGMSAFWEIVPGNVPYVMNVTVQANKNISAIVSVSGSQVMFAVSSTVNSDFIYATVPSGFVGKSAEWIDERPHFPSGFGPLMRYYNTYWTVLYAKTSDGINRRAVDLPIEYWRRMYSNDGKRLLSNTTGTYSDNHMDDYWYNCQ